MKKIKLITTINLLLINIILYGSESNNYFLSQTQRTPEIKELIDNAFLELSCKMESNWTLRNGGEKYLLCNIDDQKLVKQIIFSAKSGKKEFYFLDLGAGGFEWGRALVDFLNSQNDFEDGLTFHIISTRGESNINQEITQIGHCFIYEFGNFKIEDLQSEFEKRNLYLNDKLDLIVSSYTLRHLIDPLTTYLQAYNLLAPYTGLLLSEAPVFSINPQSIKESFTPYINITNFIAILNLQQIPFLMYDHFQPRDIKHFLVLKKDEKPLQIPFQYSHFYETRGFGDGNTLISFTPISDKFLHSLNYVSSITPQFKGYKFNIYGVKSLYQWISQKDLFIDSLSYSDIFENIYFSPENTKIEF